MKHNHTELGKRAGCPACKAGHAIENDQAPPGCTYKFEDNPIDGDYVCQRHGASSEGNQTFRIANEAVSFEEAQDNIDVFYKTYTGPCIAKARMDREFKL